MPVGMPSPKVRLEDRKRTYAKDGVGVIAAVGDGGGGVSTDPIDSSINGSSAAESLH